MKLAVFTDDVYRMTASRLFADLTFPVFICGLAPSLGGLTLIGRLERGNEGGRHPLPAGVRFVSLRPYSRLAGPVAAARAVLGNLPRLWRALDSADIVLVMGPHPLALALIPIALLRRRRLVLGVRQDYPRYIEARHPGRTTLGWAARVFEGSFRVLSRRVPVVVVGPELARAYARSRRVHDLRVSLVSPTDVARAPRSYGGPLRILSVGRIDHDKNPLLLAEILAELRSAGRDWRLTVCGEGPLEAELRAALEARGVIHVTSLPGFVAGGEELAELYRESHFLLHIARTEGVPQVLYEAFATGLPVVATDVGGVRAAGGEAVRLIAPDDAEQAVSVLRDLAMDEGERSTLAEAGLRLATAHTRESELARLSDFLARA